MEIICKNCNTKFSSEKKSRKFCSKKCSALWNIIENSRLDIECEICGKKLSKSNFQKHMNVHNKVENKCIRNKMKCQKCGKDISLSNFKRHKCSNKAKIDKCTSKNNFFEYNRKIKEGIILRPVIKISDEQKKKISDTLKNKMLNGWVPAHIKYVKSEEGKMFLSDKKKQLYKDFPEKHPNRKLANNRNHMSYPERITYDWLIDNNIEFEHQKQIDKYFVDFFIVKFNFIIEIDGEYWHNDIDDKERDDLIKTYNYKIYRIKAKERIIERLKEILPS